MTGNEAQVHLTSEWEDKFWIHPYNILGSKFLLHCGCEIQDSSTQIHCAEQKKPGIKGFIYPWYASLTWNPEKGRITGTEIGWGCQGLGTEREDRTRHRLGVTITVSYLTLSGSWKTTHLPKLTGFKPKHMSCIVCMWYTQSLMFPETNLN